MCSSVSCPILLPGVGLPFMNLLSQRISRESLESELGSETGGGEPEAASMGSSPEFCCKLQCLEEMWGQGHCFLKIGDTAV